MSFGAFLALSFSLSIGFVVRVAFVMLIGYYVDMLFGTLPWAMAISIVPGTYMGWLSLKKAINSEDIK